MSTDIQTLTKEKIKLDEPGLYDVIILNDTETDEEIPTETPEDIWELLQALKKKDEEENSD